jgi:proline iminopeptidase
MRRTDFVTTLVAACAAPAILAASPPAAVRWFPTAYGQLAYERLGQGPRRLVFLMGGPGIDPAVAAPLVADLASENEVIVFHQRGTGASYEASLAPGALTVAGAVADLEALRRALGRETLHLVGQSWGSMLAMAFAAAHRPNVASLTLLNPGGPNLRFMRGFSRHVMSKLTPEERAALSKTAPVSAEQLRIELLGDVHDRANIAPLLGTLGPRSSNRTVFQALMNDAGRNYDVRSTLAGFGKPTFLLFGDDDASLAAKDDLVALFPQAQLVTLADAGHLGWLDQPVAYRDAVLGFTRTLTPAM